MILQVLTELGPWAWFLIGLLLLIGEVLLPGVFMIWFGMAALLIGTLTLATFTDVAWWPWQAQVVAFGVLSFVFVMVGSRLFPTNRKDDAAASMNDPLGRLVGREASLEEDIVNGAGRVRLGDTTWSVRGSDLPAGTRVKITGADNGVLQVEAL